MSLNTSKKIVESICAHYGDTVLSIENLYANGGIIEADFGWGSEGAVEGTDDLLIKLTVPKIDFKYVEKEVDINSVAVDVEVSVFGAKKKSSGNGWDWIGGQKFRINPDPDRVNTSLFSDGIIMIDQSQDADQEWELPPFISKSDDEQINEHLCQALLDNSSRDQIVGAITELISDLHHNV